MVLILGILSASIALTGCSIFRRQANAPQSEPVPLYVRNDNFLDMNIAVVSRGVSRRIGMVMGNSSGTFALARSLFYGSDLVLTATPIGGRGRATTDAIVVSEGQEIEFYVASVLAQSRAVVR